MGDTPRTNLEIEDISQQEDARPIKIDLSKLEINPLSSGTKRAGFSCGTAMIDNFFKNNVKDHHEKHKIRAYIATYEGQLVGYYCLVAQSQLPKNVSVEAQKKFDRVGATPCVYLVMLGVDSKFQGNKIGSVLTIHAMIKTLEVAHIIGVYALTLEEIDQKTSDFYKKLGFKFFVDGDLMMYISLSTIKDAFTEK